MKLGLPIDDEKVGLAWVGNGQTATPEIYELVMKQLYFRSGQKKDTSCESSL